MASTGVKDFNILKIKPLISLFNYCLFIQSLQMKVSSQEERREPGGKQTQSP